MLILIICWLMTILGSISAGICVSAAVYHYLNRTVYPHARVSMDIHHDASGIKKFLTKHHKNVSLTTVGNDHIVVPDMDTCFIRNPDNTTLNFFKKSYDLSLARSNIRYGDAVLLFTNEEKNYILTIDNQLSDVAYYLDVAYADRYNRHYNCI